MIAKLAALVSDHPLLSVFIAVQVISNAITALPTPRDNSSMFYSWFFKTSQGLLGAIPRLLAIYKPDLLTAITGQTSKTTIPPNPPKEEQPQPQPTKESVK